MTGDNGAITRKFGNLNKWLRFKTNEKDAYDISDG